MNEKIEDSLIRIPDLMYTHKAFTKELGASAGYLLSVFCKLQESQGGTGRCYYRTLQQLLRYVPWLKKSVLHAMIQRLKEKQCINIHKGRSEFKVGKSLGYSVSEGVMSKWRCVEDRVSFSRADAIKFKSVGDALVLNVLCRQWADSINTGVKPKINRNSISRETGVALSTVSDSVNSLKSDPEMFLQCLSNGIQSAESYPHPKKDGSEDKSSGAMFFSRDPEYCLNLAEEKREPSKPCEPPRQYNEPVCDSGVSSFNYKSERKLSATSPIKPSQEASAQPANKVAQVAPAEPPKTRISYEEIQSIMNSCSSYLLPEERYGLERAEEIKLSDLSEEEKRQELQRLYKLSQTKKRELANEKYGVVLSS